MRRLRAIATLAVIALLAGACGSEQNRADGLDLDRMLAVSCSDAVVHFVSTDATRILSITVDGLASRAAESQRISLVRSTGDADVTIVYRTGRRLDLLACTDALDGVPIVETEERPTQWSLTVTAASDPDRQVDPGQRYAEATLRIERLEFEDLDIVTPYEIDELQIGWLPG